MSSKMPDQQQELNALLSVYLENQFKTTHPELEITFGTKGIQSISRIDYENVIKKMLSVGFKMDGGQKYMLRIQNEHVDARTGKMQMSNIRTELQGLTNIQEYCKTNIIIDETIPPVEYTQKEYFRRGEKISYPVDFDDWNFRLSFKVETPLGGESVTSLVDKWKDNKKTFRLINRVSLVHPNYPAKIDLSIVKESRRRGKFLTPEYTVEASGLFHNPEKYEIEIEVLREKVGISTKYPGPKEIWTALKPLTKYVLSGLQQTNYPISYPEQNEIKQYYAQLVQGSNYNKGSPLYPKNFIGPSSYTLQIENIAPIKEGALIPNIRNNYTVTDKADGIRKLLYVSEKGKIYLMDTNMNIQFTGAVTKNKELFKSLLDGEHILHNKKGQFINLYAAFDIYFIDEKDVRSEGFVPLNEEEDKMNFRYSKLVTFVKSLKPESIVKGQLTPIKIDVKKFYSSNAKQSIFQACNSILEQVNEGLYEYETDGLIFTPMSMGVGSDKIGVKSKPFKTTWDYSFKWKPVEFNTVDFLITTKKTADRQEYIGNIFQDGKDTSAVVQLTQYKTVILRVGFDVKKHGYINPCLNIKEDDIPSPGNVDDKDSYKPVQFFPTNPYDEDAGICNILIREDSVGNKKMFTEEGEVIEDNMIIEFRYVVDREKYWKWVPLRVRYDKTAEYRRGEKNYGNAYHVANSNWHSLHNPVTKEMMSSGTNIPDELGDDDIYYNKVTGATQTRALRDFHNLFVKKLLIMKVSKFGDTLIDYAVGKGGDLSKWIAAKLSFVFGIDVSRDNLENHLDGACARYLNFRKKFRVMPDALFTWGNSSVNIRNTDAFFSGASKQIAQAVFGEGPKDEKLLGKGVYRQYGKGQEGFNVSSIQFAIHYMFESQIVLQNFLRNVSECTKVGGYFIGTSYDGKLLFDQLNSKKQGESISILNDEKKIWDVKKQYDRGEFNADSSCVGYAIDVYQESINKTFREYLVNYEYLTRLMENYGFVLLTNDEAREMGLPASTGMFNELFGVMEGEISRNKRKANEYGSAPNMSAGERQISFLNRYFVYRKVRAVDAYKVSLGLMNKTIEDEQKEEVETAQAINLVSEVVNAEEVTKIKPKRRGKLKLVPKK